MNKEVVLVYLVFLEDFVTCQTMSVLIVRKDIIKVKLVKHHGKVNILFTTILTAPSCEKIVY